MFENLPPIARWTSRNCLDVNAGGPRAFEKPAAELYDRLAKDSTWKPLLEHASSLRDGLTCQIIPEEIARGDLHLLLRIKFCDGIIWVARMLLPVSTAHSDDIIRSMEVAMESEVVTMMYVKANSTIPVPEVYGYNTSHKNAIGAPYMLIEHVQGTSLFWKCLAPDYNHVHHVKVIKQVAIILAQLWTLRFSMIGSLHRRSSDEEIYIGEAIDRSYRSHPPFHTTIEYFNNRLHKYYADALHRWQTEHLDTNQFEEKLDWESLHPDAKDLFLAQAGLTAASMVFTDDVESECSFPLMHGDLSPGNIIVNDECDIVAIIDWSWSSTIPAEQFGVQSSPFSSALNFIRQAPEDLDRDSVEFVTAFDTYLRSVGQTSSLADGCDSRKLEICKFMTCPSSMLRQQTGLKFLCLVFSRSESESVALVVSMLNEKLQLMSK
jgi:Phosphotransferase enzyme family